MPRLRVLQIFDTALDIMSIPAVLSAAKFDEFLEKYSNNIIKVFVNPEDVIARTQWLKVAGRPKFNPTLKSMMVFYNPEYVKTESFNKTIETVADLYNYLYDCFSHRLNPDSGERETSPIIHNHIFEDVFAEVYGSIPAM